jgi:hypothetical protein
MNTVGLPEVNGGDTFSSKDVLSACNRLHMLWINTYPDAAEMV